MGDIVNKVASKKKHLQVGRGDLLPANREHEWPRAQTGAERYKVTQVAPSRAIPNANELKVVDALDL